jgi:hypothetical protein
MRRGRLRGVRGRAEGAFVVGWGCWPSGVCRFAIFEKGTPPAQSPTATLLEAWKAGAGGAGQK